MLQQYILEDEAKDNIFDWIRDFKDYEIRNQLQGTINILNKEVTSRDQKILQLQLMIEELMMHEEVDHERDQRHLIDEESFQSGLSATESEVRRIR